MTTGTAKDLLLDATHAAFIQGGVATNVASCDAACLPSLARAYGCRVAPDRRTVTLFLPVARAQALLRDLRAGGAVAAVFTRPETHATLQLKGAGADIVPLEQGDRELMRAYGRNFMDAIEAIGFRDPFVHAMVVATAEEAVGIRFTPSAAFDQTPGPAAGQPLKTQG